MAQILRIAVIHASATALYVVAVASFLFYGRELGVGKLNLPIVPIVMLLLVVFSAGFTGAMVFLRPALWYLEGRKREAITLLAGTLGLLLAYTLAAIVALILVAAGPPAR